MQSSKNDEALLFRIEENCLNGVCVTYVDDILQAGTTGFLKLVEETELAFQCKDREYAHIQFAGIDICTMNEGCIIHQKNYAIKLKLLPKETTLTKFRSKRQKLMRITNYRPDVTCAVAKCTQAADEMFQTDPVKHVQISTSLSDTSTKEAI